MVYRHLSNFFSKWEILYHLFMILILFPIGNYYFIGSRYFTNWWVFCLGTTLVFLLYSFSVVVLTLAIRWVIRRYPAAQQATERTLTMLVVVSGLTVVLAVFDVFIYSLFTDLGTEFNWKTIRPILILGLVFDLFLCTMLDVFYIYTQWQHDLNENEQLKREALQNKLNALKMQINPHFLFNSLNSLSSLISEDHQKAERFVDELAKVYRYMLQAHTHGLVPLESEVDFLVTYSSLLSTRYGYSLRIDLCIDPIYYAYTLPPLSLQTLIDNAIKHNTMSPAKPLTISIRTTQNKRLIVQNTLQRKVIRVTMSQAKLADLSLKYRLISDMDLRVIETDTHFGVTLPLFMAPQVARS
jgi:hypothetical protein